ncbi:uncharacterized protein LOC135713609 [Ochlerotatus camptorhynchus]|uniref:uncharacterized protein LOC135713609 n=1 Tax=Ochlerotatus camptorhynchus TaxID=644619 RepID=UPI0031D1EB52
MFITSLVPIKADVNGKVLFQNPRPSSTRFCRPVRIQLVSETTEVSINEKKHIENQIDQLVPTVITVEGRTIIVRYEMVLTMVDGKVCNAVTGNKSSQTCYICNATPKLMNNLDSVTERVENSDAFQFGLSTLHAWIRFMEYFLHLSYRLEIKKWQVRGQNVQAMKIRKNQIQKRFKVETGLIVDKPKPGGSGTSNDGNTARRFFSDPKKTAAITGLDVTALERCGTILQVLASGHKINTERFSSYCIETAKYLVDLYPWYYMPASVHKILIHGAQVINHFTVPIGQLSEEAQESRNKDLKRYRRDHTRKCSRTILNLDLIRRLLVSSDPLISSMRKSPKKETKNLSQDAKFLLSLDDGEEMDSEDEHDVSDDFEV